MYAILSKFGWIQFLCVNSAAARLPYSQEQGMDM